MSDLIQEAGRHAVYTTRFAGHLANLFDPYSERLKKELRLILLDAPETTQNIRRINQIIKEFKAISLAIYGEYNADKLLAELEEFSALEVNFAVNSLTNAINTKATASAPAAAQIWAAVVSKPLVVAGQGGVNLLGKYIEDMEAIQVRKVGDLIKTGFMTGRTNNQIALDIAGKGGFLDKQNRREIKGVVRTATNHVSNIARQKTYDDNSDILKGYEIVSALDSRTSDICRGYDGKIVLNNDSVKPMPPFHLNCRTTTAPVLQARFSIDDGQGTRASKGVDGGEQVPATNSYYDWLSGQGKQGVRGREFVQDVLGQERGKLFLDGGLSVAKFKQLTMDELFRPIPLSELRKKTSLQTAFDSI